MAIKKKTIILIGNVFEEKKKDVSSYSFSNFYESLFTLFVLQECLNFGLRLNILNCLKDS